MKKERKAQNFIKKPYYEGGMSALKAFIKQHLVYPKNAAHQKIEGTVHIRYTINYQGKVVATKIISGIGFGCDEEATRLVELLQFTVPRNRNLKAVFHKNLQIHFRLPTTKQPTPPTAIQSIQYHYQPTKQTKETIVQKKSHSIIIRIEGLI